MELNNLGSLRINCAPSPFLKTVSLKYNLQPIYVYDWMMVSKIYIVVQPLPKSHNRTFSSPREISHAHVRPQTTIVYFFNLSIHVFQIFYVNAITTHAVFLSSSFPIMQSGGSTLGVSCTSTTWFLFITKVCSVLSTYYALSFYSPVNRHLHHYYK